MWGKRKKMKEKQQDYNEAQKIAVQQTLKAVQEKTEEVNKRISDLQRINRLGHI